jgi:hypothetical protein
MSAQASDTIDPATADDGLLKTNGSPTAASAPANATEGRVKQTIQYTTNNLPNEFLSDRGDEIPERYSTAYFKTMDKQDYPKQNVFVTFCHADIGTLKTVQSNGVATVKCDIIVWPPTIEKASGDTREDPPRAGIITFWGENAQLMMDTFHSFLGKDY